jgi:dienelactone hydrolase
MFGFVTAFLPWVVYWILVGNTSYLPAVAVAFAVAVVLQLVQLARHRKPGSLEIGGLVFFALSLGSAFVLDDAVIEQWLQPLSNGALFVIALVGVLVGRPFVRDAARSTVDAETAATDGFRWVTTAMTWMWVGVFALMTASSVIPPLVEGSATIRDAASPLSIICYWVIPFALFGIAGAVSAVFPGWFDRATKRLDEHAATDARQEPGSGDDGVEADVVTAAGRVAAPATSLYSDPLPVVLSGFTPGAELEVGLRAHDLLDRAWAASARFTVGVNGAVDLSSDAPRSGDWEVPSDGVAVQALRFAEPGQVPDLFVPPAGPLELTIEVREHGATGVRTGTGAVLARRTVERLPAPGGVTVTEVDVDGCRGLLALPAGAHGAPSAPEGLPAVACFGGSEGGVDSLRLTASILAAAGYAALVTAWTDVDPDGAPVISRIPLERFGASLEWLRRHGSIDEGRVAALGISRGAEGLLAALAAGRASAAAAVALSPSSVRWQAVGDDGEVASTGSWTSGGDDVDWLAVRTGELVPQLARNGWRLARDDAHGRPTLLRLRPAYESGLHRGARTERRAAAIDAAAIDAPLLIAAGTDDQVWPSVEMAAEIRASRAGSLRAHADVHLEFEHAGHLLRLGLQPADALWTGGIALGGTREGQAAAERELWPAIARFLDSALGRRPST